MGKSTISSHLLGYSYRILKSSFEEESVSPQKPHADFCPYKISTFQQSLIRRFECYNNYSDLNGVMHSSFKASAIPLDSEQAVWLDKTNQISSTTLPCYGLVNFLVLTVTILKTLYLYNWLRRSLHKQIWSWLLHIHSTSAPSLSTVRI